MNEYYEIQLIKLSAQTNSVMDNKQSYFMPVLTKFRENMLHV